MMLRHLKKVCAGISLSFLISSPLLCSELTTENIENIYHQAQINHQILLNQLTPDQQAMYHSIMNAPIVQNVFETLDQLFEEILNSTGTEGGPNDLCFLLQEYNQKTSEMPALFLSVIQNMEMNPENSLQSGGGAGSQPPPCSL